MNTNFSKENLATKISDDILEISNRADMILKIVETLDNNDPEEYNSFNGKTRGSFNSMGVMASTLSYTLASNAQAISKWIVDTPYYPGSYMVIDGDMNGKNIGFIFKNGKLVNTDHFTMVLESANTPKGEIGFRICCLYPVEA